MCVGTWVTMGRVHTAGQSVFLIKASRPLSVVLCDTKGACLGKGSDKQSLMLWFLPAMPVWPLAPPSVYSGMRAALRVIAT